MERVSILDTADVITDKAIRAWLNDGEAQGTVSFESSKGTKLADLERQLIEKTLDEFDGHRQKTAESLGIGVRTLGMKLKKWKCQEHASMT